MQVIRHKAMLQDNLIKIEREITTSSAADYDEHSKTVLTDLDA